MIFSSIPFLFIFFPLIFLIYFISPYFIRNLVLVSGSLLFYFIGEPNYFFLIIFSIFFNYFISLLIDRNKSKLILYLAIVINILIIFYFKYYIFSLEIFNTLGFKFDYSSEISNIILPLGISFFTFQIISYLIDIHTKKSILIINPINFSLYISFFPQLIAGPIVRINEISKQLQRRIISFDDLFHGIERFIYGLGKKIIIANPLSVAVDQIFSLPSSELSFSLCWIAAILFALQIYYDFSGYSDMAIGLARIFGFKFPENFNYPYSSFSFKEFWRKWHITLSSWFRDYLYIPLGGNRHGGFTTFRNLFIVFFLCGLWHGASLNFILWGIYHGFFLCIERVIFVKEILLKYKKFSYLYFIFFMIVSWVIFRSNDINQLFIFFSNMFNPLNANFSSVSEIIGNNVFFLAFIGCYFSLEISKKQLLKFNKYKILFLLILLFLSICVMNTSSYQPFIYFRF